MVRSKERREAYIHEVGHVDISHVKLEPPGDFPTTILRKKILGNEHPYILTSMNKLAGTLSY
jgi:hypothetical protein